MIRNKSEDGWELITHAAHARLAGELARHWKNEQFEPPKPFAHILDAVTRHDDSWINRDRNPQLTDDDLPEAFSSSLVGTYEAFEEIELEPYLQVRANATEKAIQRDPYAAVLISMHTVNLLTEQADLDTLDAQQQKIHSDFIQRQRALQSELKTELREHNRLREVVTDEHFDRAFEFLQACDSLSLYLCVDYEESRPLRHKHPRINDEAVSINYERLEPSIYTCDPWPFDQQELDLSIPHRNLENRTFDSIESFQTQYKSSDILDRTIILVDR